MDFHVYFHNVPDPATTATLARLEKQLAELGEKIMAQIDDVLAKVQAQTTLVQGVATLLGTLKAIVDSNATTAEKLTQIDAIVSTDSTILSDALTVNTPVA